MKEAAIAGGIELFAHLLMKLINADRFLTWVARSAAGALAIIDFVFMIAVVIKKARTYVKEV